MIEITQMRITNLKIHCVRLWICSLRNCAPISDVKLLCRRPAEHSASTTLRVSAHSSCCVTDNLGVLQSSRGWRVRRKAALESSVPVLTVEVATGSFHTDPSQTRVSPIPCHCGGEETFLGRPRPPSAQLLPAATLLCSSPDEKDSESKSRFPFSLSQGTLFFFFLPHLWWRNSPFCYLLLQVTLL